MLTTKLLSLCLRSLVSHDLTWTHCRFLMCDWHLQRFWKVFEKHRGKTYRRSEKKRQKTKKEFKPFRAVCEKKNRGITKKSLWHYSTAAACHCCIILVKHSSKNEILNRELRTLELCLTQPQTQKLSYHNWHVKGINLTVQTSW